MDVPLIMPQLGTEIDEAQIDEWLVEVGDMVEAGEQLVLITTPKLSMELESPAAGVVKEIRIPADELAAVGAILAIIDAA